MKNVYNASNNWRGEFAEWYREWVSAGRGRDAFLDRQVLGNVGLRDNLP